MGIKLIKKEALTVFVIVLGVLLRLLDRSGNRMGVEMIRMSIAIYAGRAGGQAFPAALSGCRCPGRGGWRSAAPLSRAPLGAEGALPLRSALPAELHIPAITSDLSLVLCNSREVRKVQEIAVTCRKQMREILGCLEFLRRGQGPGDPALRQSEKRASISLYNSVCFMVLCGSHSFLVPECTKEATKVSQAVLKAKIQKLADNLETCTRAMDEVCDLLESRTELSPRTRRLRSNRPRSSCASHL
uniref:Uncharacterized protein n=1 Tax=Zonotrichia albicollis TaxID=44394 RepID=A0A8D2MJN7_ZONAL